MWIWLSKVRVLVSTPYKRKGKPSLSFFIFSLIVHGLSPTVFGTLPTSSSPEIYGFLPYRLSPCIHPTYINKNKRKFVFFFCFQGLSPAVLAFHITCFSVSMFNASVFAVFSYVSTTSSLYPPHIREKVNLVYLFLFFVS